MATQNDISSKYGAIARSVTDSGAAACCDPAMRCCDPITKDLYGVLETEGLPEKAVLASLGCGNPTALTKLKAGETVLDLGSGGGIDVLLSAKRVGPTGKAYGLDMTDDMLALARENQRQAGATNVEFLKGEIENIPLPDNSVDVIISNCVINLSADKSRVLKEAFRVLRPGGRFAVSDVVVRGEVPDTVRKSMLLWVGCIAGALEESDYRAKLKDAGFESIDLEPIRTYDIEDARVFLTEAGIAVDEIAPQVEGKFLSAFIRATKPAAPCCGSGMLHTRSYRWESLNVPSPNHYNVLFLCTGNSARSIMAEAILKHKGKGVFAAYSAGSHPSGTIRPEALQQIEAAGLSAEGLRSKSWDEFSAPDAPHINFIFTVCDNAANEVCPIWPGHPMTAHWGIPDPATVQGMSEEKARAFCDAFTVLDRRISLFLSLPLSTLERLAIQKELDSIGKQ